MPTPPLEEPTTKITFFIFTKDFEILKQRYGHGYSAYLREIIKRSLRKPDERTRPHNVRRPT